MKNLFLKFCFVIILSCSSLLINAQADYIFSSTSGNFSALSNGLDINVIEDDDEVSIGLPIGFSFEFGGVSYSHFKASSNGFLYLDTSNTDTRLTNDLDNVAEAIIAPLWDDLDGSNASSQATYLTTGISPNRILTIEWLNWEWNYAALGEVVSFQVKMHETSNKIDFVYRQEITSPNNPSASIGLSGVLTGVGSFLSLNSTGATPIASSTSETDNLTTAPSTGRIYTFTEPSCKSPGNIHDSLTTGTTNYIVFNSKAGSGKTSIYEYGVPGFTPGTGTILLDTINATGGAKLLTGLSVATTYDIYIKIVCSSSDTSKAAKFTFSTTYPNPQKITFNGFTGSNLSAIQSGWIESQGKPRPRGTTSSWINSNAAQTASLSQTTAKINLYTDINEEWLISPKILIKATDTLKFTAAVTDWNNIGQDIMGSDDSLIIMVSSNGGSSWSFLDAITANDGLNATLSEFKFSLAPYTGKALHVGFLAQDGPIADAEDYDFHIGEIFIGTPPMKEIAVLKVIEPVEGSCGKDSMKFKVVIKNEGVQNQSNFPVYVKVAGSVNSTISKTVALSVAGATDTVSVGNISLRGGGAISFTAFSGLIGDENLNNDTIKVGTINISASPSAPSVTNSISLCSGTDTTVTASNGLLGYRWFSTDGTLLSSDSSHKFTNVKKADTAFVETYNFTKNQFGPASNAIGAGSVYTSFTDGLVFNASATFTLDSVTVYAGSAGTVTVRLLDASNTVLQTRSVSVNGVGAEEIGLGFTINPGTGYQLDANGSTVTNLYRNSSGSVFPYNSFNNAVSITRTINSLGGYYYFFYQWKITSEGCASERAMVVLDTLPSPKINLGPDTTFCKGVVNYTIDATTPNSTYLWNDASSNATYTATNQGSYICKVTDNTGCFAYDTVVISAFSSPIINFPNVVNQCTNSDTLQLKFATPKGGTYGGASVSNGILDPSNGTLGQNVITYSVIDKNNCTTIDTAFYMLFQAPSISFTGSLVICENDTSIQLSGGTPVGGTYVGSSISNNIFNPSSSSLGSQSFKYTYVDNNGCSDSTNGQIEVKAAPNALISPLGYWCLNGGNRVLTEGTPAGGSYFGNYINNSNFIPDNSGIGNHSVFYTYTNTDNCSDTVTNNIEIEDFPKFKIIGDSVGCGTKDAPVLETTLNGMTYLWSNGVTADKATIMKNGIAWVKVTDPGTQAGCSNRDSINVTYEEACVGIDEYENIKISFYPNPASDHIKIDVSDLNYSSSLSYKIVSVSGQIVKKGNIGLDYGTGILNLDIKDIDNGTYTFSILVNNEQLNSPFIIAR